MTNRPESPRIATLIDRAVCGDWPHGNRHTSAEKVQRVYLRLVTLASSGVAYPSQETLSTELGLARRDVRNSLRILQEAGFLEQVAPHAVGKHGTVYRPIVKDRCRRAAGDPEVVFGDETCPCGHCAAAGLSGGINGGRLGGKSGGDRPATRDKDQSVEETDHYPTLESGELTANAKQAAKSEPLGVAREAIREVARRHCSHPDSGFGWEDVRDSLDDAFFWQAVEQAQSLLDAGTPPEVARVHIEAWVQSEAESAGLI